MMILKKCKSWDLEPLELFIMESGGGQMLQLRE